MHLLQTTHVLRHFARTALAAGLALVVAGCQASLFRIINVTSGDHGLRERMAVMFDPEHHLAMDVFAPKGAHGLPVVVFFYGGSWQGGKRQWYRWMGETLARQGLVVAVPDYRKYPRVRMDGFMTDAANAVAWMYAHAGNYGGNPRVMFLMGHSAGAHIAALLATDRRWLTSVGMEPQQLAGFIGLAGPYDFLPLRDAAFIGMFGATAQTQTDSQPIHFVDGDEPPMLLLQGTDDRYVQPKNACSLARRMRARGEPVAMHMYEGIGHIRLLLSFSHPLRGSSPALHDTMAFIGNHLSGSTGQASSHGEDEKKGCSGR